MTKVKGVPVKALEEYNFLKETGACNMADRWMVRKLAKELELKRLYRWTADLDKYSRLIEAYNSWSSANS